MDRKSSQEMLSAFQEEANGSTERIWDEMCRRLLNLTSGCRPSMHEPDEASLDAQFSGKKFDNAGGFGEMEVTLVKDFWDSGKAKRYNFNLASLIALARIGAAAWLDSRGK